MRTLRLGTADTDLEQAAALLREGGLVAIPTETVYGLAVRADDATAVARLFAAKGRPADNPLIVHVADAAEVTRVAAEVTPLARQLLERFAPGPLTVVLPARADLPRAVTGGLDTVAVRIPDHPVAREILRRAGVPLAAPSANRSGRPSPTRPEHVLADLDGRIAAVVDAGPTRVGLESTVVDARGPGWRILREGGLAREAIVDALGHDAPHAGSPAAGLGRAASTAALAPGTRHRHYAPSLPVHLVRPGAGPQRAAELAREEAGTIGLVAVRRDGVLASPPGVMVLAAPDDVAGLAADLFTLLREAEVRGLRALIIEGVPDQGLGRAVMDRLRRAAEASGGSSER